VEKIENSQKHFRIIQLKKQKDKSVYMDLSLSPFSSHFYKQYDFLSNLQKKDKKVHSFSNS